MAVTLWKAEYHHLAFLEEVIGSQSSMAFSRALLASCKFSPLSLLVLAGTAIEGHTICRSWLLTHKAKEKHYTGR
jgi:hypothetical protein